MTEPTARLRVEGTLDNLSIIRGFIETGGIEFGIAQPIVRRVMLAVDELTTNIVSYGYAAAPGPIEVEMALEAGCWVIRLRDEAPPYDPTTAPDPTFDVPLEERAIGGLGVFLARQVLDELHHSVSASGGNELTLIKQLS